VTEYRSGEMQCIVVVIVISKQSRSFWVTRCEVNSVLD
jgi:hypothetical protein